MRKTSSGLMLAFSAVAVSLALTGCGEPDMEAYSFKSVDECVAGGVFTEAHCKETMQAAIQKNQQVAPRFESIQDCEKEYGENACSQPPKQAGSGASDVFVPAMMGFMMGRMMDGGGIANNATQPLYQSRSDARSNRFSTATGKQVNSGRTLARSRTLAAPTKAVRVSRGGMGVSARGSASS